MQLSKIRELFHEVVHHRRLEHHTANRAAINEFIFTMSRKGRLQSGAFNTGKVKIYCEAFAKCAGVVWNDMQRIMASGFEPFAGCEEELVGFFKTSMAAVYETDKKLLFEVKQFEVTPTTRHLAQCKPQFDFAYQAITAKLSTEIKIFVRNLLIAKPPVQAVVIIQSPAESKPPAPAQPVVAIQPPAKMPQAPEPIDVDKTLLWLIQQRIQEKLDLQLRSMPSASQVFVCFCRDKLTVAKMQKKNNKWSGNTIKLRLKSLKTFLNKEFGGLTLEACFVDQSMFKAAEDQANDYRAKKISRRALGE